MDYLGHDFDYDYSELQYDYDYIAMCNRLQS